MGVGARADCPHQAGWTQGEEGVWSCARCGTRRFTDYGALRPPGLPEAKTPSPAARRVADRRAAGYIAFRLPRGLRWGRTEAECRASPGAASLRCAA
ncbi:DUF6255 family natural product biosynthesis protein [Streptomyces triculaminicus]|uniref:DUF6255 family natural product biosynthesis protein n=1 Tax=Streptomyces triculaminicus TaxID=2816232 RepID=UPI00355858F5